jgi:hypothetical protein
MGFLNTLLVFIKDFIESLFSSSSPEFKKKQQLKNFTNQLRSVESPLWRQDGFLLPTFPATLNQIAQFIQPIKAILDATIASTDHRTAERYHDYLLELALTEEQRAERHSFTLQARAEGLVAQQMSPDRVIEEQGKRFTQFLHVLDTPTMRQAGVILQKLDAMSDFCHFDFNSLFSYFDPAFKAHIGHDSTVESPTFHAVEVVEVIPVLMDLYYLLTKLDMNQSIVDIVAILDAKRSGVQLSEDISSRIHRVFQAVIYLLQKKVSKESILAIIRVTKGDAEFVPEQPKYTVDYVGQYRERLTEFFHSDSRKLLKEKEASEIQNLITATFGDRELETIQGYNETTNLLIQEFTPFSLEWIKPLEVIKTFSRHYFDHHFKQILRSVIVEGYFTNRTLQSSLSSSYYYCESIGSKIVDFEQLFMDNQPCSLKILTGYLTELEKGMDFEKPLRKMVENMNTHARNFVQQAVNNYMEVFNFGQIVLEDNKKSVPDFITNIRTLSTSTKNSDSFGWLERENGVFRNFLEIMKKYAIVGTLSVPANLQEQTEN